MASQLENIKDTLINPVKIADYLLKKNVKYYYRYYKNKKSKAKYLRVVVKYINGEGFIITSYYVEKIR